jgi:hypothetical protein
VSCNDSDQDLHDRLWSWARAEDDRPPHQVEVAVALAEIKDLQEQLAERTEERDRAQAALVRLAQFGAVLGVMFEEAGDLLGRLRGGVVEGLGAPRFHTRK